MDRQALFPDHHAEGARDRSAAVWDTSWPLPVPRFTLTCPICGPFTAGGGRMVVKDWKFHVRARTGSKTPWRCDVRTKCLDCGHVPIFGVLVSEDAWLAAEKAKRHNRWITWRQGKQILAEAGYFEEAPDA